MDGYNRAMLVGNLGKDPEVRQGEGKPLLTFSMATTESWKDASGRRQEETEWHNVVVFGGSVEPLSKMLAKGMRVFVEGKIRTRVYTTRDGGQGHAREIVARQVLLCGGSRPAPGRAGEAPEGGVDDEIPY